MEILSIKMGECQNQLSMMREKFAAEVLMKQVRSCKKQTFSTSTEASPDMTNNKDDSGISCDDFEDKMREKFGAY